MEEKKNIYQRILALMEDVGGIKKVMTSGNMKYDYIPVDAIKEKLRPLLVRHGIYLKVSFYDVVSTGNNYECKCILTFINVDAPEDRISSDEIGSCSGFGVGIDNQDKGPGKAQSYAFKNAIILALMLEGGDDVEADQSPEKSKKDKEADLNKSISGFIKNFENKLSGVSKYSDIVSIIDSKDINKQLQWLSKFRPDSYEQLINKLNSKKYSIFEGLFDDISDQVALAESERDIMNITADNLNALNWCKKEFPGLYEQLDGVVQKKRDALKRQVENE